MPRFGLQRLFLAAVLTAIPFAVFASFGWEGQALAIFIAAPLLLIAILATPDQLRGAMEIFIYGAFGFVFGSLFAPPTMRPSEQTNSIVLFVVLAIGLGVFIRHLKGTPR